MNLGMMKRRMNVGEKTNYLMTSETNPEVLAVCYAQGWCASPDHMTYGEAAAVTNVGEAFRSNTSIKKFDEFENFGVSTIASNAFRDCTNLSSIKIPTSVAIIDTSAFRGTMRLPILDIPSSVTSIRAYAFNAMGRLASSTPVITLNSITPPVLENINAFDSIGNKCNIYVPSESVSAYKAASVWSELSDRIFAIPI